MWTRPAAATVAGLMAVALLTALRLTEAGASGPTTVSESSPAFQAPPIDWGRCRDRFLRQAKGQCGKLVVPLDHTDPEGPKVKLAVSRVPHTRKPYRGVVLTNPGGPGSPGTWMAGLGQFVPGKVAQTYDRYGLDPRGVGSSKPALTCDGRYFEWDQPEYVRRTPKLMRDWRQRAKGYTEDCAQSAATELLPHLRTVDNVNDFESLRKTIGADEITIFGGPYGTYIAQVYATLYPDNVQALIMDAVVDPDRVWYPANLDQDRAFQKTFEKFLAWIGEYPQVFHLGHGKKAVERRYHQLRRQLAKDPAGGKVGPEELHQAVLPATYTNLDYVRSARAFSRLANRGDAGPVKKIYRLWNPSGPGADNGYAIYVATQCTDAPWPQKWSTWVKDMWRVHKRAPYATWWNAWYNTPCLTWPVEAQDPVAVNGEGLDAPVLLLGETFDAATPLAGALAVRSKFPTAALVEGVGGTSHGVSLFGVRCTDITIANLLRDGSLPKRKSSNRADKKCPSLMPPNPTVSAREAALRRPLPVPSR